MRWNGNIDYTISFAFVDKYLVLPSGRYWVIYLYLKLTENSMGLIFLDRF